MNQNNDSIFDMTSSSPLFASMLGISGALLIGDTLINGALLCAFTTIVAVCLSSVASLFSKRSGALSFWMTIFCGAIISFPLMLALGVMITPEKAACFSVVGVTIGYAFAKKESSDKIVAEIKDSLFFALMYSVSVVIFSFVRELLANGSILGIKLFDGIEFFGTLYGSLFLFVAIAIVYRAASMLLTKGRNEE